MRTSESSRKERARPPSGRISAATELVATDSTFPSGQTDGRRGILAATREERAKQERTRSSDFGGVCIQFHLSRLHSIIRRTMHAGGSTPFQNGRLPPPPSNGSMSPIVSHLSEHPGFANPLHTLPLFPRVREPAASLCSHSFRFSPASRRFQSTIPQATRSLVSRAIKVCASGTAIESRESALAH